MGICKHPLKKLSHLNHIHLIWMLLKLEGREISDAFKKQTLPVYWITNRF